MVSVMELWNISSPADVHPGAGGGGELVTLEEVVNGANGALGPVLFLESRRWSNEPDRRVAVSAD